ncbi:EVE domain-containing protein [Alcaligenes faecalis]|uniref:EVE domain-containing protein n=1 Tax=Alcaligenes faecalis TaxID=511 RepID=UPI001C829EC9|nr:EVE domain-containing protein [Alcaligenes faecalis]
MKTWLFQANPDRFDLDSYLTANLETITWVVRQHREEIAFGDSVFIWKAQGKSKAISGVVAECRVVSAVETRPSDVASSKLWDEDEELKSEPRVELLVIRVAHPQEVLKRDWLKVDPVLSQLAIFKMTQSTNYLITEQQTSRLRALWERTGKDWSWRDSVAGLWAYVETKGAEVSKLPGSPVAKVALVTGRAVGGVYNKVMNFRAIDPSDERAGLQGASETDRKVWAEFLNSSTKQIDRQRLDDEIGRLGLCPTGETASIRQGGHYEMAMLGSLEVLTKRYQKALASGLFKELPPVVISPKQTFTRNPLVVQIARKRADSKCEIPNCAVPSFTAESGESFCEIHHVIPLGEGGKDLIENVICLCPVHHREAHHGKEKLALRTLMLQVRASD